MAIVTLTMNPCVDVSTSVDQVVADRKLRCAAPLREAGGGGLNVSRAVASLGGTSCAVYPTGGATGEMLDLLLTTEASTDTRPVPIDGWTRESFAVVEQRSNQQFRFGLPGPTLSEPEQRRCLSAIGDALASGDHLVVSGSLPPGVPPTLMGDVADLAEQADARLVVDVSGEALQVATRAGAYLAKPNLRELAALVGQDHLDDEAQEDAARTLVADGGTQFVLVSRGAAGVLLVGPDGLVERVSAPSVPVRSRIGAGDSTVAGTVLALTRGARIQDAARFGVAAGAAAVMTAGTGLCTRDDTERLYERIARPVSSPDR